MSEQPGRPGRYERSPSGLLGAMLILLVVIAGFVLLRSCSRGNQDTPVRAVDYLGVLTQARAAHRLLAPAPAALPKGWEATSVRFTAGSRPTWHLGLLTDRGKYVGIEETGTAETATVETFLGAGATRGVASKIGPFTWQSWIGSGGNVALTHAGRRGTLFVGGSAAVPDVRRLTAGLTYGSVSPVG